MTTPLFERDGDRLVATPLTAGPWDRDHAHGGATSALLAHELERVPSLVPMTAMRLTVELFRPLTRAPVQVRTQVLREGRRVQLVQALLVGDDGTQLSSATALRIRHADVDVPPANDELPSELVGGPDGLPRFTGNEIWPWGFFEVAELRVPDGELGPSSTAGWVRLTVPVVDDEPITALSRAAAAGDFGNGVSAPLPMDRYLFINPDLTVTIDRPPQDGWVGLAPRSIARPTGVGRTVTVLADRRGCIGTALQSLYVAVR